MKLKLQLIVFFFFPFQLICFILSVSAQMLLTTVI